MRNGNVALFQLSTLHWTPNDEDDDRSPFILPRSDLDRTTKVPLRRRWWWCDNELENLCRFVTLWDFASFFGLRISSFFYYSDGLLHFGVQISKANGRRGHWCVTISDRDKKQQNLPAKRVWYEKLRNFDCGIHRQSRDHHWDMFLSSLLKPLPGKARTAGHRIRTRMDGNEKNDQGERMPNSRSVFEILLPPCLLLAMFASTFLCHPFWVTNRHHLHGTCWPSTTKGKVIGSSFAPQPDQEVCPSSVSSFVCSPRFQLKLKAPEEDRRGLNFMYCFS